MFRTVRVGRETATMDFVRSLITQSNVRRAAFVRDHAGVEQALQRFWEGSDGNRFHSRHRRARYRHFLEHHADICEVLRSTMRAAPERYHRVVELGCGDGHVLCYAAGRLPEIAEFVGVDLNAQAVEEAGRAVTARTISFARGDALDWVAGHPCPGTVALTAGGVLEYSSEAKVAALFEALAAVTPAALALVEPLDPGHDIEAEPRSRIFGRQRSFSHAYPALLEAAGFRITWSREMSEGTSRWILILAEAEGDS